MPGHTGILGNEVADRMAKGARPPPLKARNYSVDYPSAMQKGLYINGLNSSPNNGSVIHRDKGRQNLSLKK